jgi:hypothetical protein
VDLLTVSVLTSGGAFTVTFTVSVLSPTVTTTCVEPTAFAVINPASTEITSVSKPEYVAVAVTSASVEDSSAFVVVSVTVNCSVAPTRSDTVVLFTANVLTSGTIGSFKST